MTVRVSLVSVSHSLLHGPTVISTPMDLQTMLKKVKQRQYKSKKEFKDDLDLIWSNCFTYNATEVSSVSEDSTTMNTPISRGTASRPNRWNPHRGGSEVHFPPRRPLPDAHTPRQPHRGAEDASLVRNILPTLTARFGFNACWEEARDERVYVLRVARSDAALARICILTCYP